MSENRKELKDFPLFDQHITHFLLSWDHLIENIVVDIKLLEHFYSNKLLDTNQYENLLECVKTGRTNRTRRLIKYLLVNMRKYGDRVKPNQQGAASSSSEPSADEEDPYDVFMRTLTEMGPSTSFIPLFMNAQITVRVSDVNLYNHLFHASSRFSSKSIALFRRDTAHQDLASSNAANSALNSLTVTDPTNVPRELMPDRDGTDRRSLDFTKSAEASSSFVPSTTTGPSRETSSSSTATTKPKQRRIPPPLRDFDQDESATYFRPAAFRHEAARTGAFGDAARSSSASRPVRGAGARRVLRQAFTETRPGFGMPAYPTRSPGAPKHTATFTFEDESMPASSGERTPDEAVAPDENDFAAAAAPRSSTSRKQLLGHRRQGSDGRTIGGPSSNDELFVQGQRNPVVNANQLRLQRSLLYALLLS